MLVCGVLFKDNGKIYYFDKNNIDVKDKDYVIVDTEKGEQLGKIAYVKDENINYELKKVIRLANKEDYNKYLKSLKESKEAIKYAKKCAQELKLDMQFVDASFTFDEKQLIINFIADERIDFRELVKKLASKYKIRIDLHQIGVRDKAKELGGIGPCGRKLCCSSFLQRLDTITINMAKNQNIALNPNKINGSCGRLLCCLSYEDDNYIECRKKVPTIGSTIKYKGKEAKIESIDLLNMKYTIINDQGEEITIFADEQ